jgi:hypothetical protein
MTLCCMESSWDPQLGGSHVHSTLGQASIRTSTYAAPTTSHAAAPARKSHMGPALLLFHACALTQGPHLDLRPLRFLRMLLTLPPLPHACTRAQQLQQAATAVGPTTTCATPNLVLQHLDEILRNICSKQLKHLQHTYETLEKHNCSHCKTYAISR